MGWWFSRLLGSEPDPRGYPGVERSSRWRTLRNQYLAAHRLCAGCGKASDLEAHHIIPYWVDPALELEVDNLIPLCDAPGRSCHFTLGHGLNWRGWVPNVRAVAAYYLEVVRESNYLSKQKPL